MGKKGREVDERQKRRAEYAGGGIEGEGWSFFDGEEERVEATGAMHEKLQRK